MKPLWVMTYLLKVNIEKFNRSDKYPSWMVSMINNVNDSYKS